MGKARARTTVLQVSSAQRHVFDASKPWFWQYEIELANNRQARGFAILEASLPIGRSLPAVLAVVMAADSIDES